MRYVPPITVNAAEVVTLLATPISVILAVPPARRWSEALARFSDPRSEAPLGPGQYVVLGVTSLVRRVR